MESRAGGETKNCLAGRILCFAGNGWHCLLTAVFGMDANGIAGCLVAMGDTGVRKLRETSREIV